MCSGVYRNTFMGGLNNLLGGGGLKSLVLSIISWRIRQSVGGGVEKFSALNNFMENETICWGGRSFEEFSTLNNFKRTGFVLGCDRYDFKALLGVLDY